MNKFITLVCAGAVLLLASPATAVLMSVTPQDTPSQDLLWCKPLVHELGNQPPFPTNEWITSSCKATTYRPCIQNPDTATPNIEVTITNMTIINWPWLVYVADPETTLANDDGLVNGQLAFHIDKAGVNTPLVSESLPANPAFEPNETWKFVIQDYSNTLGLPASAFGTVGVGNVSAGDMASSGSIIPEPGTLSLLVLGVLAIVRRRRTE